MKVCDDENFGSSSAMLDMITDLQSARMDSQRAEPPVLRQQRTMGDEPEDEFLDMVARVQGSRLEDQRSELPKPTVPDDDFFALLMRAQAGRMEDQRAAIPARPAPDASK